MARDAGGNATAAAIAVTIANGTGPASQADLVTTAVGNPSAYGTPGCTLTLTSTVRNAGTVASSASKTRDYLSLDQQKGADPVQTAVSNPPVTAKPGSAFAIDTVVNQGAVAATLSRTRYYLSDQQWQGAR